MKRRKYKKQNLSIRKINASLRAKKTLKILGENGGKSMGKAMREANFSEAYSKHPENFKRTRAWQEICANVLNDELLGHVHMRLLKHKNFRANTAGLDMAYKVKGKYAPEQIEITRRKYQDLSNEELMALKKKLKARLLKK